jgi:hypothetical protein
MATLVLSTIGTALGGPIGGAIGALIGQSFDQQLLAPASRGPRLGDLSVQTSSYGTQIPRIYGSMRVAGSVIWATDLVESEQTTGAKGQPDVTYSYSVSLAVALSSRTVGAIGRIWADGKLLRGVEGDFKVPTTFRFYDGGEAQEIDPLIGSIEGISNTPAYRGLALAVFENLELAAFGNRIPFMTFEVIADVATPQISSILTDASAGAIAADASDTLVGYAAYGRSSAAAVQPLVEAFDIPLFDDGSVLRSPLDRSPVAIGRDEFGNSSDGQKAPKLQREQLPVRAVPSALRVTYYDPARDYQTGEARAIAGEPSSNEVQQELPAVLTADGAKTLVQQMLARQWSARDRLTLRLPPARIGLEPGSIVEPGLTPSTWIVEKCTVDGFVTNVELRPAWRPSPALTGEAGRMVANSDLVEAPTSLALIEVPAIGEQQPGPSVMIAASSASPGWRARTLSLSIPGQSFATQTAVRKSVLGQALTLLGNADPYLIDEMNSVDVELVDAEQWLTSCDDDALAEGVNVAVLGGEIIQFGDVTPLGNGRFRLKRLLRGRGGSEWACAAHAIGELFCLVDGSSLRTIPVPAWATGSAVTVADRNAASASIVLKGESARPLPPVNLSAATDPVGDLSLSWTRRSRAGFAWIDEIDAPLGESREQYRVTISGTAGELDVVADQAALTVAAADLGALGSGAATIEVRQLGDWAASRPAQVTINLA